MSEKLWSAVDVYIVDKLVGDDRHLAEALAANAAGGLPAMDVSAAQGKFLNLMVRITGARRVLEIGTLGGYSTIWMARALPADGRLVTLEYEPRHAAVAGANLERAGLSDKVTLHVGPGTVIILDNVVRDGEVVNPHNPDPRILGTRLAFDMIGGSPRLDATALQTVGSKGWDGFALMVVD